MTERATLKKTDDGISIEGGPFSGAPDAVSDEWDLVPVVGNRWLLYPKKGQQFLGEPDLAAVKADPEILTATLFGLVAREFTGTVGVDTGRGLKKLFFQRGELVFASSNLIDDRLGEVIYRSGLISLEQMTDFAVQVTRSTKFGKVLLNNKIFNSLDLWNALKAQVAEIVRSIFLCEKIYFQISNAAPQIPTAVIFSRGTRDLLADCAGFGAMFRNFLSRVNEESRVTVNDKREGWQEPKSDTYEADLVELVRAHSLVGDLLRHSKLTDTNTYVGLYNLVSRDICSIDTLAVADAATKAPHSDELKVQLDRYRLLLKLSQEAFANEKLPLPVGELKEFVNRSALVFQTLYVNEKGEISQECLQSLYVKSRESDYQRRRVATAAESLVQFLLQINSDFLPQERAREIRKNFFATN